MSDGTENPAPQPGTPEYDAAMAAKYEGQSGGAPQEPHEAPQGDDGAGDPPKAEKPDWLPEKFWDAESGEANLEGLAKSYSKLESDRGQGEADHAEGDAGNVDDAGDDPAGDEGSDKDDPRAAADAVARAEAEFEEKGELSDSTYEALEKAGIPRATAEAYVDGINAVREVAFAVAGGPDEYGEMTEWMAKNLTAAEVETYDRIVNEGTVSDVAAAVRGMTQRFASERTVESSLVQGDRTPTGVTGFKSGAEMTAAMSDPRYAKDPAFRAEVEKKIAAAEKAGVNLFI